MRKLAILSMIGLTLLACSLSDVTQFIPQPLPPTVPNSPSPFPTWTETPPVPPTMTFTPTMIGQKPTPTRTGTPTWTPTMSGSPTMVNTIPGPRISPTPMPGDTGFESIQISTSQIVVGNCGSNEVTFNVLVSQPAKVESVVMFMKLRNKATGEDNGWDRGTTLDWDGEGQYSHTLKSSHFPAPDSPMWVLFQMVGTDDEQQIVARSAVFQDRLTLVTCP